MKNFMRLARKRPITILALLIWVFLAILIVFSGFLTPYDPYKMAMRERLQSPNHVHWMGTDRFGRDVLSRVMIASRATVGTSLAVLAFAAVSGILVGSVSGYYRALGAILMRIVDAMMAFPSLLIALFLASIMGRGFAPLMFAAGVAYIARMARLVHGITLSITTNLYIDAARAVGVGSIRLLMKHVVLNALSPIIVQTTFFLAHITLTIAALEFLGVGLPPDVASWGNMIAGSRDYIVRAPWLLVFPGSAISLTVIATNIIGDTLRDALDPRSHEY